jgi:hypothetical protein
MQKSRIFTKIKEMKLELFTLVVMILLNLNGLWNLRNESGSLDIGYPFLYIYRHGLSESDTVYMPLSFVANVLLHAIFIYFMLKINRKYLKLLFLASYIIVTLSIFFAVGFYHDLGCTGTSSMCNG